MVDACRWMCAHAIAPHVVASCLCVCVCVILFFPPPFAPSFFHQQTPNAIHTTTAAHRRGAVPGFPYQRRLHGQP